MTAVSVRLKFQLGARTLATIPRRLVRVALSLDDVLAGETPMLPALPAQADGYVITSLPADRVDALETRGLLTVVRQRYVRYHADLRIGEAAWLATLSGSARSGLKRKTKRLATLSGGRLDIRAYRTPAEIAVFHPLARTVSATTYQERLLGSGLPDGEAALQGFEALAAADRVRAWLLFVEGRPIAYLCCTAQGGTLRYDHVGHGVAGRGDAAAVRRPLRLVRLHRGGGTAQAAVRNRGDGVRRSAVVAADAGEPRDGGRAGGIRWCGGQGKAYAVASATRARDARDPALSAPGRRIWNKRSFRGSRSSRRTRKNGRCIFARPPSSSPFASMASMARSCGR
jgi:hypothetical protein